jgi:hypothetical protein
VHTVEVARGTAPPTNVAANPRAAVASGALICLIAAACSQSTLKVADAGATQTPNDASHVDDAAAPDRVAATDAGNADGATCLDPYAGSSRPNDPCAFDTDCHSPFLACTAQMIEGCRDVDAGCPRPGFAAHPLCPKTGTLTTSLCSVRYQLPCMVDADCGPDGFTCQGGRCQQQAVDSCDTAATCPAGWDCYTLCPCYGPAKHCYPPFAISSCSACLIP